MTPPPLPAHLRVSVADKVGQYASAFCRRCGARAYIARYEDPGHSAALLQAWVNRHTHEVPKP